MPTLQEGSSGPQVKKLQTRLQELGFNPGAIDGDFGPGTEAAVMAFQKSQGLLVDGVAGPRTLEALELNIPATMATVIGNVTVAIVSKMFPATPLGNIKTNLPFVLKALEEDELTDKNMVLMALATIRAETGSFMPLNEFRSRFNTSPGGHPFDLYDNRRDLGNQGPPDGERFKGRGFVQLTGRANYQKFSAALGLGNELVTNPDRANEPETAAKLLSFFLKDKETRIKQALLEGDLRMARRLVNGGSHGLDQFTAAFRIGQNLIP